MACCRLTRCWPSSPATASTPSPTPVLSPPRSASWFLPMLPAARAASRDVSLRGRAALTVSGTVRRSLSRFSRRLSARSCSLARASFPNGRSLSRIARHLGTARDGEGRRARRLDAGCLAFLTVSPSLRLSVSLSRFARFLAVSPCSPSRFGRRLAILLSRAISFCSPSRSLALSVSLYPYLAVSPSRYFAVSQCRFDRPLAVSLSRRLAISPLR